MITIGSLFSGIGGLELGLEWAGLGPVIWQCEIDPFCRDVLAKHWPHATRYEDVRGFTPPYAEIVCGGFPCQDVSSANTKAKGLQGERSGLWREFRRIVEAIAPKIVVVENVASGARRWLPHVRRDLHMLGYRTRAFALSAADVGAPFLRRRVFVVARSDGEGQLARAEHAEVGRTPSSLPPIAGWWPPEPPMVRVVPGVSGGVVRALGNAVVPQCAQVIGRVIVDLLNAETR